MSINFFEPTCQEQGITNALFGLCDDQNGKKAYTNVINPTKWIATVKNDNNKNLLFTAIDKCIIKDNEQIGRGRCDGMLTSDEHLYFVELKNANSPWQTDAIEQLESTIQFFKTNHNIDAYRYKKAFACNKKKEKFRVIDNEFNIRFYRTYGFRIDIQAEILVV